MEVPIRLEALIGHRKIKKHLVHTAEKGRVPHAQLFNAPNGSGALGVAIAYARLLLCQRPGLKDEATQACDLKMDKLTHPDLHFAFPVATNDKVKKHPTSDQFIEEWRSFVLQNPYGSLFNWYQSLGIENKQGQIGVDEAEDIVKKLALKSFEGGYKVLIIWMAEKLNGPASNKLLKLIEEPPDKTVIILITENKEQILGTILSRCQVLDFNALSEEEVRGALEENFSLDQKQARRIAHQSQGNWNRAIHLMQKDDNELVFEKWFIVWIRTAFRAKGNATVVQDLVGWSEEIAKTGRETQKRFLMYCSQVFRQAMLANYGAGSLVYFESNTESFDLKKLAPFIHGENAPAIHEALEEAIYHIERNGNSKIIFLDLSMQLTRLLHTKEL